MWRVMTSSPGKTGHADGVMSWRNKGVKQPAGGHIFFRFWQRLRQLACLNPRRMVDPCVAFLWQLSSSKPMC